ncbi:glycoside hydrolase family 5 protein [Planctomycetales bacterium ZRK34]|nr:glycoside hydrolase family 5 protein [Planctomycetales bacterium ZRK34]
MKKTLLALMFVLLADATGYTQTFAPKTIPNGVGVNIHFKTGHEDHLDLIAAAGIKVVRMDFTWAGIERTKGEYDFSAYDELTANLLKRGIQPLYILDYSNKLYEEVSTDKRGRKRVNAPTKDETIEAFAAWARAAVDRFKDKGIIWEIWNEPNIGFWHPEPDVEMYNKLAHATCKAIREVDPDAIIVAPGTSRLPMDYLEKVFASGLLAEIDGVTVHPYRHRGVPPETVEPEYRELRKLIDKYAPEGKKGMPILSGEWGYTTAETDRGSNLEQQAQFIVRQQLTNVLWDVPVSIWYDWINDGPDPKEHEHNFGIVNRDLSPKPSYTALKVMTTTLNGYRIAERLDTGDGRDFVLVMTKSGAPTKLVAWTIEEDRTVTIDTPLGGGAIAVKGMLGDASNDSVSRADGKLTIKLTNSPIYIATE